MIFLVITFILAGLFIILLIYIYFQNKKYCYFVCESEGTYKIFKYTSHYVSKQFECPMETYVYSGVCIDNNKITVSGCPREGLLNLERAKIEVERLTKTFLK